MTRTKRTTGQQSFYKTLHRKLKIEQQGHHKKNTGVNSGAPEEWPVLTPQKDTFPRWTREVHFTYSVIWKGVVFEEDGSIFEI